MSPINKSHRSVHYLLFLLVVSGIVLSLTGCEERSGSGEAEKENEYSSNGERIYFTAASENGTPIRATGMMHEMKYACSDCHGPGGKGKTVNTMMGHVIAPDIRYKTLTVVDHHHDEGGSEHEHGEEHPPYTDKTIKQAITEGINPAGEELNRMMPRWKMSGKDLDNLIEHLKTMK
jgi:mono/diheme cytochrome c family protein